MLSSSYVEETFNTKNNKNRPTLVAVLILVFTKTRLESGVRIYVIGRFSTGFIAFHQILQK